MIDVLSSENSESCCSGIKYKILKLFSFSYFSLLIHLYLLCFLFIFWVYNNEIIITSFLNYDDKFAATTISGIRKCMFYYFQISFGMPNKYCKTIKNLIFNLPKKVNIRVYSLQLKFYTTLNLQLIWKLSNLLLHTQCCFVYY